MKPLFFRLLLAAMLSPLVLFAVSPYSKGDTLHVFALSGLRLRDNPNGNVLAMIPYGSKIVMLQAQPQNGLKKIEHLPGYWVKIAWNDQSGYVFDGFLGHLPAPAAGGQGYKEYCSTHFQYMSSVDSTAAYNGVFQRSEYLFKGKPVHYKEESAEGPELYWANEDLKFSWDVGTGEIFLLLKALHQNDKEVFPLLTHPDKNSVENDGSSAWSLDFDENSIRWSWSH